MIKPDADSIKAEILYRVKNIFGKKKEESIKEVAERIHELKEGIKFQNLSGMEYRQAVDMCVQYYQYLELLESKIPLNNITFTYNENLTLDTYQSYSYSVKHELAVLLFNMVHIETRTATRVADFAQRKYHLKNAVAILDYLKGAISTDIKGYNIDLSEEGLTFFKNYVQSWVFINAYEQMKEKQDLDLLSKLAASIQQFAANGETAIHKLDKQSRKKSSFLSSLMGSSDYINTVNRSNIECIKLKYGAFAHYYKACVLFDVAESNVAGYGECLANMRDAFRLIDVCKIRSSDCHLDEITLNIDKQHNLMKNKLEQWEDKNKKIWKEIVPKKYAVPELINQDFSLTFGDVYKDYTSKAKIDEKHVRLVNVELVPPEVREFINSFKTSESNAHKEKIDSVQKAYTKDFNGVYSSLDLPMCLSFMSQPTSNKESSIPDDLRQRLNTVKMKGNLDAIANMFKQLHEKEKSNEAMITNIKTCLLDEKTKDNELRQRGVNLTGRIPSDMAAKTYEQALIKYTNDMAQASKANTKLESIFHDNKTKFENLFMPVNELEEKFEQFKQKKSTPEEMEAYDSLKHQYDESSKILNDMELFKNSTILSCIDDCINTKFEQILSKHNSGGNLQDVAPELSEEVSKMVDEKLKTFEEYKQSIDMKTPYSKIQGLLKPTGQNEGIQKELKEMYESYDKYMSLNGYLSEGNMFYAKLTGALGTQYQIIYDFCYARLIDYNTRMGGQQGGGAQAQYNNQGSMYNF